MSIPGTRKKNRSRVQGGWARDSANTEEIKEKVERQPLPSWTARNTDFVANHTIAAVKFQQPAVEEAPQNKNEQFISSPGVYDLSTDPSGVSRIRVFHNFIKLEEADHIFATLSNDITWKQKSDIKNGIKYIQPRVVAWYGHCSYSYSGVHHPPNDQWLPHLLSLRVLLESLTGQEFNTCLCNLYRDGKDHVSWHSDDEDIFGVNPTIASISFGDCRNFELRKKVPLNAAGEMICTEYAKVPLPHGSLILMEGATQTNWQHRIPVEYHDRGPRINLTFRLSKPV